MKFLLSILSRRRLSRQRVQVDWVSRAPGPDYYTRFPADVDRRIGVMSEIGMGGPNVWVQYLRDGAILGSVHTSPVDVDGGRLRVALTMSAREGKRLLAYDPAKRCIHVLSRHPGLDEAERFIALSNNPADPALIKQLWKDCACSESTQSLHQVHGLWVPMSCRPPRRVMRHVLADGRILEARLLLPEDLRCADDPWWALTQPLYALHVDGQDTGRHVTANWKVDESPNGRAFSVSGLQLDGSRIIRGLLHLFFDGQWFTTESSTHPPGPGVHWPRFLEYIQPQNDGSFRIQLTQHVIGSHGEGHQLKPASPTIRLRVDWKRDPITLPVRADIVVVRPTCKPDSHTFNDVSGQSTM